MGVKMTDLPLKVQERIVRDNPNIFLDVKKVLQKAFPGVPVTIASDQKKRVKQGEKLPNKLERDWQRHLEAFYPSLKFHAQRLRFRLANGAWYRVDISCLNFEGRVTCWETKGPREMKNVDRGILTIKFAATAWPEVRFILVWRDKGGWHEQEILP